MKPTKIGQVAKFNKVLADEDPNQLYVVLEIKGDDDSARDDIIALNTGLSFPQTSTVLLNELEVVAVDTNDIIGHTVTINKADYSQATGKVLKISQQKIMLDLKKGGIGFETNVLLTIIEENGNEQMGALFVS